MVKSPGRGELVTPSERFRFLVMFLFAAALVVAIFSNLLMGKGGGGIDDDLLPREPESRPPVKLDPQILAEIRDATPTQRVHNEEKPWLHMLSQAALLVPGDLERLGMNEKPMPYSEILENPGRFRGEPVWVKARLVENLMVLPIKKLPGVSDIRGSARDQAGNLYYFSMAFRSRRMLGEGDWVKIKGFFFKLRENIKERTRVPYIIGRSLVPSWRDWAPVEDLDPAYFGNILDNTGKDPETTEPESFYHFLSYARNKAGDPEALARAERLDKNSLTRFSNDPVGSRGGKLYTFYVSIMLPTEINRAEENPLELDHITRIWGASVRPLSVIRIIAPGRWKKGGKAAEGPVFELESPGALNKERSLKVTGVFYRNLEYEAAGQDMRRVRCPIFIAAKIEEHGGRQEAFPPIFGYLFIGLVATSVVLIILLVRRDRKKHEEAEKEIRERRRRRREREKEKG